MSSLAALEASRLAKAALGGPSSGLAAWSRIGQTRAKSQKVKVASKRAAGFSAKNVRSDQPAARKDKKLGSFMPLSRDRLTDPVFEKDSLSELELAPFRPRQLTQEAVGQALQFTLADNEVIKAYGVPKNLLVEFRILSNPCTVVRSETVKLVDELDAAQSGPSSASRVVLTGPSGCGKSTLLLQAVEYAVRRDWIVLYISRAIPLVTSSTPFSYDPRTRTYEQPDVSYEILRRFQSVNAQHLNIPVQTDYPFETRTVRKGDTISQLAKAGVEDPSIAAAVLLAVMEELTKQTAFPVLLAVDDIQAMFRASLYRDPQMRAVMPYHLSLPRKILEFAGGKRSFPMGAFYGAASTSHTYFKMPLELSEALSTPFEGPSGPYEKRHPEFIEYAKGLRNFPVPAQMQVKEASALFEIWAKDRALHSMPNDELFMSKFTEASGNPRDFVWKGLLSSFAL
ncbi:hypothetical protein CERSUDRAFT_104297 [Gelatoporia subvermispora B]|uniref:Small ribosomal subunit protein mS29 n=1 Tax=Ceriporiopsis subvermispora (strain B) TaxID=914234 RepID=M2RKP1_CERS8|nr:hypothetical protein CERSUDRAFT_104297 [Gelatoporia subvermispora B]